MRMSTAEVGERKGRSEALSYNIEGLGSNPGVVSLSVAQWTEQRGIRHLRRGAHSAVIPVRIRAGKELFALTKGTNHSACTKALGGGDDRGTINQERITWAEFVLYSKIGARCATGRKGYRL